MLWRFCGAVAKVVLKTGGKAPEEKSTVKVRAPAAVPAGITAPVIGLVAPTGTTNVPGVEPLARATSFGESSPYWIFA
jgi:hypothetical protein